MIRATTEFKMDLAKWTVGAGGTAGAHAEPATGGRRPARLSLLHSCFQVQTHSLSHAFPRIWGGLPGVFGESLGLSHRSFERNQ